MMETNEVVITNTSHCREVISLLSHESVLAMDCRKIEKGYHGQLTLLLLGTSNGVVYLFDLQENKKLMTDGGLPTLLESAEIVKVTKGCERDSTALFYEWKVSIQNVFDTEIADNILEECGERLIFPSTTASDLCARYLTDLECEELQRQVSTKEVFWGKRPLTAEMKSLAANHVRFLLPELYETQKRCIQEKSLWKKFQEEIKETHYHFGDPNLQDQRQKRRKYRICKIIDSIEVNRDSETKFLDLPMDGYEVQALGELTYSEACGKSEFIKRLKAESIDSYLKELDDEIMSKKGKYQVTTYAWSFLSQQKKHTSKQVSKQADDIQKKIKDITLYRMRSKYGLNTNLEELITAEILVLTSLFPLSTKHVSFSPTILRLFWITMETSVDEKRKEFDRFGKDYKISGLFYKRLSKYANCKSQVPKSLHEKARTLKLRYDETKST